MTSTTPAIEDATDVPDAPRRRRIASAVVVVLVLAAIVIVRAVTNDDSVPTPTADGLWTALAGDVAIGSGALTVDDLSDTTPAARNTTVAVWGSVERVEAGPTFSGPEDGAEATSVSVGAVDDEPQWIHLVVRSEESVGGAVADVIRIELWRPGRWRVSDLAKLPADSMIAVLVPVTQVFEGDENLLAAYDHYDEPVYRVFAKSVFTEPRSEDEHADHSDDLGTHGGHPDEIYAPFYEGNEYDQMLAPVEAANNGSGVSSLSRLWAWFMSTEQEQSPK